MPELEGYQRQDSALRMIGGSAVDMAYYLTAGNPFFTRRIGTVGWNPNTNKWLAKLNPYLAPDRYKYVEGRARRSASRRVGGAAMDAWSSGSPQAESMIPKMEAAYQRRAAATYAKHLDSPKQGGLLKTIGESGFNRGEAATYNRMVAQNQGLAVWREGSWLRKLVGEKGGRHAAAMFGIGRILTRVNAAMLVYEAASLAFKPVEMLADLGARARAQPRETYGTGIRTPELAMSLRQQAVAQMQASQFGPRSLIGNESQYLHV